MRYVLYYETKTGLDRNLSSNLLSDIDTLFHFYVQNPQVTYACVRDFETDAEGLIVWQYVSID